MQGFHCCENTAMIETPALIKVTMVSGHEVTMRAVRYSDPADATYGGAFTAQNADGEKIYALWAGILFLSVFENPAT